ncbi:MAG TPA: COX15/CtaA family protein [Terriglobales bacterium]|nr:COX15/CtaA family protein [Terriglobales bacterium]
MLASATFVLLVAGALVTSNDAGLAVPDWPTSFGSIYRIPPMVGGVRFEHSHRMIAELIGLLTIVMAVWTWRADARGWLRRLALGALALVIFQGVLGGTTVLNYLPPAVSSAHATFAQTFFCVAVLMALFTSRSWVGQDRLALRDEGTPGLRTLSVVLLVALYAQLILGAAFRHVWTKLGPTGANRIAAEQITGAYLVPHVLNALLVTALLIWVATRVLARYGNVSTLRRPATVLLFLVAAQLMLGFGAYLARVEWGRDAAQPHPFMVWSTVAHVVTGAALLGTSVVLTAQVYRNLRSQEQEEVAVASEKATA